MNKFVIWLNKKTKDVVMFLTSKKKNNKRYSHTHPSVHYFSKNEHCSIFTSGFRVFNFFIYVGACIL